MQVKLVVMPADDGLHVLVWGKWTAGSMRVRHFESRTTMIATLEVLGLITADDGRNLDSFCFTDACPLFSAEIDEDVLAAHGFDPA